MLDPLESVPNLKQTQQASIMKNNNGTKYTLIGIGLVPIIFSIYEMATGSSLGEIWTMLLFGVALIVIGFSLGNRTKAS